MNQAGNHTSPYFEHRLLRPTKYSAPSTVPERYNNYYFIVDKHYWKGIWSHYESKR